MHALCASIITAGALIGLGLAGIGLGLRYQNLRLDPGQVVYVKWGYLDTPMMLILVVLLGMALSASPPPLSGWPTTTSAATTSGIISSSARATASQAAWVSERGSRLPDFGKACAHLNVGLKPARSRQRTDHEQGNEPVEVRAD